MKGFIKKIIPVFMLIMLALPAGSEVSVKLRNLCFIDGYKKNQLFGYGMVVGLQGTGDSRSNLTKTSMKNLLRSLGLQETSPLIKNSAAVIISADIPANLRVGDRVDVYVSSIGDARSLEGGVLVQSPLKGADGVIYVVAQGRVIIQGNEDRRGVKTTGIITGGGIAEREIRPEFIVKTTDDKDAFYLVLNDWNYSTADKIIKTLQKKLKESTVSLADNGRIMITIPENTPLAEFIGTIENTEIVPDMKATVVINEKDGTIVTGGNVIISEAMISRRGMIIEIENSEKKQSAEYIKDSTTVQELVESLNSVGAGTADIIAILKALKASGALHAELIVR